MTLFGYVTGQLYQHRQNDRSVVVVTLNRYGRPQGVSELSHAKLENTKIGGGARLSAQRSDNAAWLARCGDFDAVTVPA